MDISAIKENVKKHGKVLNAIIADILTSVIIVLFFAINAGLEFATFGFMLIMATKPFVISYINVLMKGEVNSTQESNIKLREELVHIREIAEYRCLLSAKTGIVPEAVKANKDWYDSNEGLVILNGMKSKSIPEMKEDLKNEAEIKAIEELEKEIGGT